MNNVKSVDISQEAVEAVSYENADGTLYGYANHKNFTGNPGAVPVRIIREGDYQAMVNALTASEKDAARYRWLRHGNDSSVLNETACQIADGISGHLWDRDIDAAMAMDAK